MQELITYVDTIGVESTVEEGLNMKVVSVPDPEKWGKINPYPMLESPKGSTIHEKNFPIVQGVVVFFISIPAIISLFIINQK